MLGKIHDIDDLQETLFGFAAHRVITVAGRTGILGALSGGYETTDKVAQKLKLDPLATGKMVRALTALGLCEASKDRYRVTADLAPYFRSGPKDLTPFLEHSHSLYERWGENLEAWVRGQPWETKRRDQDGVSKFGLAMQAMGVNVAARAAEALDLQGAKRMLDVGGGLGHFAKAFLEAEPGLKATVLDIPEVAEFGRKRARGLEIEQRLEFVGGDYLEDDWGAGFDLVLIANVLHQENERQAATMIGKGSEALCPGGRLAVVDFAIDDDGREHIMGTLFAINMRSFGNTYGEPSIRGWMSSAGLERLERFDLSPLRWLIAGTKPL